MASMAELVPPLRRLGLRAGFLAWAGWSALGGCPVFAGEPSSDRYYPTPPLARWTYDEAEIHRKKNVTETVVREEATDPIAGEDWAVLRGQRYGLAYWVRTTPEGVFLCRTKRKIPILGKINVTFKPPMCFLKFPLREGQKWTYDGLGKTWIKNKRIHIDFENLGLRDHATPKGPVKAWHIRTTVSTGKGKLFTQESWYGQDVGYLGGTNSESHTWVTDWSVPGTPGGAK